MPGTYTHAWLSGEQVASKLEPQALYCACRSGDSIERADAYQQLGQFLLRVALSRLHSKPDLHPHAQECAQEALVAVWQKLEAGQGPDTPARFLSWCAAIVIHKVYDELRRLGYSLSSEEIDPEEAAPQRKKRVPQDKRESLEQLVEHDEGTGVPWAERIADPHAADPEADTLQREGAVGLLLGIRKHPRVSEESTTVLMCGFLAGLADAELAARLGTSKSNVRVIRSRDLSKLRDDADFIAQLRSYYGHRG